MKKESEYSKLFKDPRWQKKRLEILQRDEFSCQSCYDTEETLHIHHKRYIKGKKPWEYPDSALITLCETCHEAEKEYIKEYEPLIIEQIRDKFLGNNMYAIAIGFHSMKIHPAADVCADAFEWFFCNNGLDFIVEKYLEDLKTRKIKRPYHNIGSN